jgi:hypothetical protein
MIHHPGSSGGNPKVASSYTQKTESSSENFSRRKFFTKKIGPGTFCSERLNKTNDLRKDVRDSKRWSVQSFVRIHKKLIADSSLVKSFDAESQKKIEAIKILAEDKCDGKAD